MSYPVDRPDSVKYEYRGIEALIAFKWGAANSDVPIGLRIQIDYQNRPVLAVKDQEGFGSFGEAVGRGKKEAEAEIDRLLK